MKTEKNKKFFKNIFVLQNTKNAVIVALSFKFVARNFGFSSFGHLQIKIISININININKKLK